MHSHQASCLRGPISRSRGGWPQGKSSTKALKQANRNEDKVPSLDDPDIRSDLVLRIRREIAEGTYDTPEKLQAALDRLLERLE